MNESRPSRSSRPTPLESRIDVPDRKSKAESRVSTSPLRVARSFASSPVDLERLALIVRKILDQAER
jgi:hypothetical protein